MVYFSQFLKRSLHMKDARIVVDSSANMAGEPAVYSVPLKIITDTQEYIDDVNLNTAAMVWDLKTYTGKSSPPALLPRIGWKPLGMHPMYSALPLPAISPAAAMPPILPRQIMSRHFLTARSVSSIAFPPAVRWN
jgi:hypothetical protein